MTIEKLGRTPYPFHYPFFFLIFCLRKTSLKCLMDLCFKARTKSLPTITYFSWTFCCSILFYLRQNNIYNKKDLINLMQCNIFGQCWKRKKPCPLLRWGPHTFFLLLNNNWIEWDQRNGGQKTSIEDYCECMCPGSRNRIMNNVEEQKKLWAEIFFFNLFHMCVSQICARGCNQRFSIHSYVSDVGKNSVPKG